MKTLSKTARGFFQEKEYHNFFSFRPTTNPWAISQGFAHEIILPEVDSVRYANIGRTVAVVAVDEDENGKSVVETWKIKLVQWEISEDVAVKERELQEYRARCDHHWRYGNGND